MARTTRIVPNIPGFNALRNRPEVAAICEQLGQDIADRASARIPANMPASGLPDFDVTVEHSASRVQVYVRTATFRGRLAEARDRVLLNALGGA